MKSWRILRGGFAGWLLLLAAGSVPAAERASQPNAAQKPAASANSEPDAAQPAAPAVEDLPELFRFQKVEIQRAWRDVSRVVAENEKLDQPLAEPYFARAEIWSWVNNNDAAIQDFLRALNVAFSSDQYTTDDYLEFLQKLRERLEKLDRHPKPAVPGLATQHFAQGTHEYARNQLQEALRCFSNAVQLAPDQPLYWYYRSATYKRVGQDQRAQHDALVGASLEHKIARKADVNWGLARVQGSVRIWLEHYRLGDPSQQLSWEKIAAPQP